MRSTHPDIPQKPTLSGAERVALTRSRQKNKLYVFRAWLPAELHAQADVLCAELMAAHVKRQAEVRTAGATDQPKA